MRELYSLGALEAICSNDPRSTPSLLDLFCDVERRSWKTELENAVGTNPAGLAYYRGLLDPRQPMKVTIVLLLLGGMPIAGFLGGEFDTGSGVDYYALHVAYDGRYHAVAPGSAVLVLAMQRAIERRYACLNLLAGFTYYKSQWLAQVTPMHTAQLYRKARLPYARRVLGDLKRTVWTRTNSMHQRFNPSRRRARSNRAADAVSELPQLPNPHLGAVDAADIEAILTRAHKHVLTRRQGARTLSCCGPSRIALARKAPVSIHQDLVLDQHPDSAGPARVVAGEIRLLLVEHFAGPGVANLNRYVVVGLRDSSDNPDKGLRGAELRCDAGLAPIAVSQRPLDYGLCSDFTHIDHAVASRLRQHPARLAAGFLQIGRAARGSGRDTRQPD